MMSRITHRATPAVEVVSRLTYQGPCDVAVATTANAVAFAVVTVAVAFSVTVAFSVAVEFSLAAVFSVEFSVAVSVVIVVAG